MIAKSFDVIHRILAFVSWHTLMAAAPKSAAGRLSADALVRGGRRAARRADKPARIPADERHRPMFRHSKMSIHIGRASDAAVMRLVDDDMMKPARAGRFRRR